MELSSGAINVDYIEPEITASLSPNCCFQHSQSPISWSSQLFVNTHHQTTNYLSSSYFFDEIHSVVIDLSSELHQAFWMMLELGQFLVCDVTLHTRRILDVYVGLRICFFISRLDIYHKKACIKRDKREVGKFLPHWLGELGWQN